MKDNEMKKETYISPECELYEVKSEGIVCASGEDRAPWE